MQMNPAVCEVEPLENFVLRLTFENGEVRFFDAKPHFRYDFFKPLGDPVYFAKVRPVSGTVEWPDGQDFCPDTLYLESR